MANFIEETFKVVPVEEPERAGQVRVTNLKTNQFMGWMTQPEAEKFFARQEERELINAGFLTSNQGAIDLTKPGAQEFVQQRGLSRIAAGQFSGESPIQQPTGTIPQITSQRPSPQPQATLSQPSISGIKRVGNDFFAVEDGKERPINLDEFQKLGINETFVPPGQTVSLEQAKTGKQAQPISQITPTGTIPAPIQDINQIQAGQRIKVAGDLQQYIKTAQGFVPITADQLTNLSTQGVARPDLFELPISMRGQIAATESGKIGTTSISSAGAIQEAKAPSTFEDAILRIRGLQDSLMPDTAEFQKQLNDIQKGIGDLLGISPVSILEEELKRTGFAESKSILQQYDKAISMQTKLVEELPEAIRTSLADVGVTQAQLTRLTAREVEPKMQLLENLLKERNATQKEIDDALDFARLFTNTRLEDRATRLSLLKWEFDKAEGEFKDLTEGVRNTIKDALNLQEQEFKQEIEREKKLAPTKVASRQSAIAGVIAQGIQDPFQILDVVNFDESGNQIGDISLKEVTDVLDARGLTSSVETINKRKVIITRNKDTGELISQQDLGPTSEGNGVGNTLDTMRERLIQFKESRGDNMASRSEALVFLTASRPNGGMALSQTVAESMLDEVFESGSRKEQEEKQKDIETVRSFVERITSAMEREGKRLGTREDTINSIVSGRAGFPKTDLTLEEVSKEVYDVMSDKRWGAIGRFRLGPIRF